MIAHDTSEKTSSSDQHEAGDPAGVGDEADDAAGEGGGLGQGQEREKEQ